MAQEQQGMRRRALPIGRTPVEEVEEALRPDYIRQALQEESLPGSRRFYQITKYVLTVLTIVAFLVMLLAKNTWIAYPAGSLAGALVLFVRDLFTPRYELSWRRLSFKTRIIPVIVLLVGLLLLGAGFVLLFSNIPVVFPRILILTGLAVCVTTIFTHSVHVDTESINKAVRQAGILLVLFGLSFGSSGWLILSVFQGTALVAAPEALIAAITAMISSYLIYRALLMVALTIANNPIKWKNLSFTPKLIAATLITLAVLSTYMFPLLLEASIIRPFMAFMVLPMSILAVWVAYHHVHQIDEQSPTITTKEFLVGHVPYGAPFSGPGFSTAPQPVVNSAQTPGPSRGIEMFPTPNPNREQGTPEETAPLLQAQQPPKDPPAGGPDINSS